MTASRARRVGVGRLAAAVLRTFITLPPPRPPLADVPARPGPRADGLTHDQAALAAVQARGIPCGIAATAMAEGLATSRIGNACLVLQHAPDLTGRVNSGEMMLYTAAQIARLRRDAPDLAAKCEERMARPGRNHQQDAHMLARAWAQTATRRQATGDRRFGPRDRLRAAS